MLTGGWRISSATAAAVTAFSCSSGATVVGAFIRSGGPGSFAVAAVGRVVIWPFVFSSYRFTGAARVGYTARCGSPVFVIAGVPRCVIPLGPAGTGSTTRAVFSIVTGAGVVTVIAILVSSGIVSPVRTIVDIPVPGGRIIGPVGPVTIVFTATAIVIAVIIARIVSTIFTARPVDIIVIRIAGVIPAVVVTIGWRIALIIAGNNIAAIVVYVHCTVGANDHIAPVTVITVVVVTVRPSVIHGPVTIGRCVVTWAPPSAGPVVPGIVAAKADAGVEPS